MLSKVKLETFVVNCADSKYFYLQDNLISAVLPLAVNVIYYGIADFVLFYENFRFHLEVVLNNANGSKKVM